MVLDGKCFVDIDIDIILLQLCKTVEFAYDIL